MSAWTAENVTGAWERWRAKAEPHVPERAMDDAMRRVMDYTADLLAARGGTQGAEVARLQARCERTKTYQQAARERDAAQVKASEEQQRADTLHRAWQRAETENASLRAELEALQEDRRHTTADALRAKVRALQAELAHLKANPPASSERSGQLAEDEIRVRGALCGCSEATCAEPEDHAALSRLAARAQQGQAATKALEAIRERLAKAPKHFPSAACDAALWVVDGDDAKGPAP
jgi:chromosome segregation ATPase